MPVMVLLRRAFVGLLVAATAHAGDGRIEISQACAAAGCVAGDLPGFPITLPAGSNAVLTSDITVPNSSTSAIFAEDDVALDLAGFAVVGPVSCTGEPVTSCSASGGQTGISAARHARVHGGSVRGFAGDGIAVDDDSRVFDVIVSNNGGVGITGGAAAGRNVVAGNNAGGAQIGPSIDVIACNQVAGAVVCPP